MVKSWFGWLSGSNGEKDVERRAEVPAAQVKVEPGDIDPVTGALRWERFLAMMDAEQQQAPGVLLVVDLSARSESLAAIASEKEEDILPWLAQAIRAAIRSDDLLSHVSGYRFAALLRGAPQEVGSAIGARILDSVDNTIFMTADGIARLGVNVGGAVYESTPDSDVLAAALENLRLARETGTPAIVH